MVSGMEIYDAVAKDYSGVFDDIKLRRCEWPWLEKTIRKLQPRSLLDLGCGNGYLAQALLPLALRVYAADPCAEMAALAQQRLGNRAAVVRAAAESLPFEDNFFDVIVSFLSFRYMSWDAALGEISRTLKDGGALILIDLFSSCFNPLYIPLYIAAWAAGRIQYGKNMDYYTKLSSLRRLRAWQELVRDHPKRKLADAKTCIRGKFYITRQKLLSLALRGKTVALVCGKLP
jgi:ubiquinone/menaquinone biosynthesis C-methylase UbiE